jgi:two-component sensor histidine kinase
MTMAFKDDLKLHLVAPSESGDRNARRWSIKAIIRSPLFLATVGIWTVCSSIWGVVIWTVFHHDRIEITVRGEISDLSGFLLCGAAYLVLKRIEHRPPVVRLLTALGLTVAATAIYLVVFYASYYVVLPMAEPEHPWLLNNLDLAVAMMWTFLAWCGVYFALDFSQRLRTTEAMALDAENRMLRYQLDPHFLFNIHSALSTLIHDRRNDEAERVVLSLSAFLRRSLIKSPTDQAPLMEELRAMREYMDVEAARFGERLRFVEHVEPDVSAARTPNFILQPLLENAIKHGLGESAQPITVELGARRQGETLVLWVQDDGDGVRTRSKLAAHNSLGVGLENVRRRLQSLYGAAASVVTEPRAPHGFKVTLTLPLSMVQ